MKLQPVASRLEFEVGCVETRVELPDFPAVATLRQYAGHRRVHEHMSIRRLDTEPIAASFDKLDLLDELDDSVSGTNAGFILTAERERCLEIDNRIDNARMGGERVFATHI